MADADEPAPYQSLYRRFRPQRFDEVLGQEHVSLALRNAVRDGRVGHAYLFSGPRGTGKTSTARILAKALNCADLQDGEPCGRCPSCVEITRGTSLDVHELDAASNNGVDAMRDLVAHAALGTPGRWKVYIVDEVHMLSTAASNALLKTLEEPPGHVVFVLATTDPQKVLPTIRSRTQHLEFRLLGPDTLSGLVRGVRDAAGLDLPDEALEAAVRRGRGSARDALSALDQVAAGGTVDDDATVLAELADGLAERDPSRLLVSVAQAVAAGRDPVRVAGDLVDYLRQGFLVLVAPDLVALVGAERERVEELARRLGLAALVRAMEELGTAQVAMRDAPDPRVHLEVALIRLSNPQADTAPEALVERIERLERAVAGGAGASGPLPDAVAPNPGPGPAASSSAPSAPVRSAASGAATGRSAAPDPTPPTAGAGPSPGASETTSTRPAARAASAGGAVSAGGGGPADGPASGPNLARQALGAVRRQSQATTGADRPAGGSSSQRSPSSAPTGSPTPSAARRPDPDGAVEAAPDGRAAPGTPGPVDRDDLVEAWGDGLLASLPNRARARFRVGRFVSVDDGIAVYALPNETHRSYCEEVRLDVETALRQHFGRPVPIRLIVDPDEVDGGGEPPSPSRGGGRGGAGGGTEDAPSAPSSTGSRGAAGRTRDEPAPSRGDDAPGSTAGAAGGGAGGGGAGGGRTEPGEDDEEPDLLDPDVLAAETEPAGKGLSPAERIMQAFPGAEEV